MIFQARKTIRTSKPRPSLTPGTILILLAGRFRGKRVILLKNLPQGVLLVTGPFKVNGVPLRRVNARYVIATSYKIDLAGTDESKINEVAADKYFTREKSEKKKGEESFFKAGEKPEVRFEMIQDIVYYTYLSFRKNSLQAAVLLIKKQLIKPF